MRGRRPAARDPYEGDEDRKQFDATSAGIPERLLARTLDSSENLFPGLGAIVRATIAEDPASMAEFGDQGRAEKCAVCAAPADPRDRLRATLSPEMENGFSFGRGVWVHRACLERCPETGKPRKIPW